MKPRWQQIRVVLDYFSAAMPDQPHPDDTPDLVSFVGNAGLIGEDRVLAIRGLERYQFGTKWKNFLRVTGHRILNVMKDLGCYSVKTVMWPAEQSEMWEIMKTMQAEAEGVVQKMRERTTK